MEASLERRDYHDYRWRAGEKTRAVVLCAGLTGILAYFFYRSVLAVIPLSPVGYLAFRQIRRGKAGRAREELAVQFRECVFAVVTSLQAGYSVENAFVECGQDMLLMYGEGAFICEELNVIRRGLNINIPLEELLGDMARRSCCDIIVQFSEIFALAKHNGGNMAEIMKGSADQIGRKTELRQELQALLGGRKMELAIMRGMPFAILCYIDISSPGYFDSMYHNLTGIVIMTACLAVYLGACLLGEHIMRRLEEA